MHTYKRFGDTMVSHCSRVGLTLCWFDDSGNIRWPQQLCKTIATNCSHPRFCIFPTYLATRQVVRERVIVEHDRHVPVRFQAKSVEQVAVLDLESVVVCKEAGRFIQAGVHDLNRMQRTASHRNVG